MGRIVLQLGETSVFQPAVRKTRHYWELNGLCFQFEYILQFFIIYVLTVMERVALIRM